MIENQALGRKGRPPETRTSRSSSMCSERGARRDIYGVGRLTNMHVKMLLAIDSTNVRATKEEISSQFVENLSFFCLEKKSHEKKHISGQITKFSLFLNIMARYILVGASTFHDSFLSRHFKGAYLFR